MAAQLIRPYSEVDVTLFQGSPLSETLTVPGVDWTGTYTSQVRARASETAELVAELTVTAAASDGDTVFTIALSESDSDEVSPGQYHWDARHSDGTVRLSGKFNVKSTTTP